MSETTSDLRLERETCSRCSGTGHYSYCQMYGTVCFKCGGKGQILTKRGQAALAYLKDLRARKVSELKVGDTIKVQFHGVVKVLEVRLSEVEKDGGVVVDGEVVAMGWVVNTSKVKLMGVSPDSAYEVVMSQEEQLATLRQAIEYQGTLTKAGTVRKTSKKNR
jgi:hypothetical protein